jgi:hypothetical protein
MRRDVIDMICNSHRSPDPSLPFAFRFRILAYMNRCTYRRILLTTLLCSTLSSLRPGVSRAEDQYVVVNIIPGEAYAPIFEEVAQLNKGRTSAHVALGIGAIFSYLNSSRDQTRSDLSEFLSLSVKYDIPVIVQLDGEQWWGARPDLWNWWDQERPGYDTSNRQNVEWFGWAPEYAMKIAWRNWGRQIRVLPPPNLMSTRYRTACHDEMRLLIPLVLQWWNRLPEGKKRLFIGIKLGWESAIGVNSFYIPNGNALLPSPEEKDPQIELRGELVPDRGVVAIGYAAVSTARLAGEGVLEEGDLAEIVTRHLEDLCGLAAELGVPRGRLFTHVGGWKDEELLYNAALNKYSCPGWSFYRYASDPSKDKGVLRVLQKNDAPYWAAAEWLLMGEHDAGAWRTALTHTLTIPKCRYVCIYNWSGIRTNGSAVDAILSITDDRTDQPGKHDTRGQPEGK